VDDLSELPLSVCGCQNLSLDALGVHVTSWVLTCTVHSGAKKDHDWTVDQLAELFRTTHRVKTQQVARIRGRWCGDIKLAVYLANSGGRCFPHGARGNTLVPDTVRLLHASHTLDTVCLLHSLGWHDQLARSRWKWNPCLYLLSYMYPYTPSPHSTFPLLSWVPRTRPFQNLPPSESR